MQKYELKIQQYDASQFGDKPLTVASLELNMAQYAVLSGQKKTLDLRLPLRENAAWSVLHGDVILRIAVDSHLPAVRCPWQSPRAAPAVFMIF